MSQYPRGLLQGLMISVRRKVFVSYHHAGDQWFPKFNEMLSRWSDVRAIMRAIQNALVAQYKLIGVTKLS